MLNPTDVDSTTVREELEPGERLLWNGRPQQGIVFGCGDAFAFIFAIFWTGFAIFWEAVVIQDGAPFFFALFGLPFILVGIYLLFGRFLVDVYGRRRTFYGVTDRRIIIISGLFNRNVRSLKLKDLGDINLALARSSESGRGTITFAPGVFGNVYWGGAALGGAFWGASSSRYRPPSFQGIDNARSVYELIRRQQEQG